MSSWYLSAIISAFAFSGQFLGMQRLQKTYPITVYMTYIWLLSGILLGVIFIRPTTFSISGLLYLGPTLMYLVLGGIASWGGMYAYNAAIKFQPNVGFVEAISSLRIAIVYVASLLFLSAPLDPLRAIAVLSMVVGILLVVHRKHAPHLSNIPGMWVVWSALSGVMFSLLVFFTRLSIASGLDAPSVTAITLLIAGSIFLVASLRSGVSLRPKGSLLIILFTTFFAIVGNTLLFYSYGGAPNLAYPVAISNGRLVLLYLAALLVGLDRFDRIRAGGVAITFISMVLLS